MPSQASKLFASLCLPLWLLVGCATNTKEIENTPLPPLPDASVFDAPLDRVWSAAAAALREGNTIKLMDRTSTTMVTEFNAVGSHELSLIDKALLGKTYRNNYTLTFRALGPDKTEVGVEVGLQVVQIGIVRREDGQPHVKNVLRQRLFNRIAVMLGR